MEKKILMMFFASVAMLTACSSDDPFQDVTNLMNPDMQGPGGDMMNGGAGGASAGTGELLSFEVALDKTSAEPTSTVAAYYPEAADDISKKSFGTQVTIDMANPVAKTENGVEITVSNGHVTANHGSTEGVCYVVSGTTADGSLTIDGKTDFEVNLNNADINNPTSTALDLESKGAAYLVLTGTNKLMDGSNEDHKSTLYSKSKLLVSGTGSLEVYGVYNNGIHSKSYVLFDKGINCDYNITINGGRTNVICTGNGEWDTEDLETKAASCIKCDSVLTINGGEINVKATGSGGKGLKADWQAYITGGKIRVITTGGLYYSNGTTESHDYKGNTDNLDDAYTSSPKGIKVGTKNVHGVLNISGGDLMVRTSGTNGEGIESKGTLDISDGSVMVSAYDDAINSSGDLTINGGTVVAVGTNNDGIDANGDMHLKGGTLIAMGAGGAEAGIDINEQKKLYISGTKIFGIGGRVDGTLGSTTQGIVTTTGSVSANATVTISSGSTALASFNMPPYAYNNGTILVSAPGMESGSSYSLSLGISSQTVTASNTINNRNFR